MRPFLVCIHDATPAYARETRAMLRDLAPLVGRHLSLGVVPDWHGEWPLGAHPDYCQLVQEASDELLLHGYFHRRRRGWAPTTLLTEGSDEMNGLDAEETRCLVERGQRVFTEVFGEPARGFLAPAWQAGHVPALGGNTLALEYVLGFFAIERRAGRKIPLMSHDGSYYVAHVIALPSLLREGAAERTSAVGALFIWKAELDGRSCAGLIDRAFELTPAELRVMQSIVEVGGVPETAVARGIAETTVKTHLHRVFAKTGVSRQADLVKLAAGFSNPVLH